MPMHVHTTVYADCLQGMVHSSTLFSNAQRLLENMPARRPPQTCRSSIGKALQQNMQRADRQLLGMNAWHRLHMAATAAIGAEL